MNIRFNQRSLLQRILGVPATDRPERDDCWEFEEGKITIALDAAPELQHPGGAIRLEGNNLPVRVLIVNGEDGQFRAYQNRCTHFGHRRLDPVPGTSTVQCCSINKSTFDEEGRKIHGPAGKPIVTYPVLKEGDRLIITLS